MVSGSSIASSLAGKNYYTVAVLPTTSTSSDSNRLALAAQYGKYAHATVTGTTMKYEYDQASSTVWGMPRSVVEAGLADVVVPLNRIADAVAREIRQRQGV